MTEKNVLLFNFSFAIILVKSNIIFRLSIQNNRLGCVWPQFSSAFLPGSWGCLPCSLYLQQYWPKQGSTSVTRHPWSLGSEKAYHFEFSWSQSVTRVGNIEIEAEAHHPLQAGLAANMGSHFVLAYFHLTW